MAVRKRSIITLIFVLISVNTLFAQEIFDAVSAGDLEKVKTLIEQDSKLLNAKNFASSTPLHIAVEINNKAIVTYLLDKGALVNEKDIYGNAPLNSAAYFNKEGDIARLLIEKGADVNSVNNFQSSVLIDAASYVPVIVEHLLDNGVTIPSPEDTDGQDLFMLSAQKGLIKLFDRIVAMGGDLRDCDDSGNSLVHKAANGGQIDIINKLLHAGLQVTIKNIYGWTPLHFAAAQGHKEVVTLLLEKGADIDAGSIDGNTAYNLAIQLEKNDVSDFLSSKGADKSSQKFPKLTGKYFNQTPPGKTAGQFAIGIVSTRYNYHSSITFTPDGKEAYWAVFGYGNNPRRAIMGSRIENGQWTPPKLASFSKLNVADDVPFVSPDGQKLLFNTYRPIEEGGQLVKENIWMMDRIGDGWSEPYPLPQIVNSTENIHHQTSMDSKGNLYFGAELESGYGGLDIYCAKYINGEYQKPINLGPVINSENNDGTPYIAPDGSYMIFNRFKPVGWSIFISYLQEDGGWTQPRDLGDIINTSSSLIAPIVTHDGKYLFFLRDKGSQPSKPFWIGAGFIEELRPKK